MVDWIWRLCTRVRERNECKNYRGTSWINNLVLCPCRKGDGKIRRREKKEEDEKSKVICDSD